MEALYLSMEMIEGRSTFKVLPFQQIIFSSMEFIESESKREGNDLLLIISSNEQILCLQDFFIAESMGFFPTFVLPTQEHLSGFGFIAMRNPLLFNIRSTKGGIYGKPSGSFIEYDSYVKGREEKINWNVAPILYTAPARSIDTFVDVYPVPDESPEFYATIEQYLADVQRYAEPVHQEEVHSQQQEHQYQEKEYHQEQEVVQGESFPSYHSGYVFSQEQILQGYRVCAVNGDEASIEQMVGGYYGYLTLAAEGWFTYILGEGILPEQGSYLEDSYTYTIYSPDGTMLDGSITVQSYYAEDGVLAYQDYYTQI